MLICVFGLRTCSGVIAAHGLTSSPITFPSPASLRISDPVTTGWYCICCICCICCCSCCICCCSCCICWSSCCVGCCCCICCICCCICCIRSCICRSGSSSRGPCLTTLRGTLFSTIFSLGTSTMTSFSISTGNSTHLITSTGTSSRTNTCRRQIHATEMLLRGLR